MQQFPLLRLLERHGDRVALLIALAPLLLSGWLVWSAAASSVWLIFGVLAGLILYGFVKSYVELVRLMVDMLLPK